jgi:hypothetical protein
MCAIYKVMLPKPTFEHRLGLVGYNASLRQQGGGYMGVIRRIVPFEKRNAYPEVKNIAVLFSLDANFNIIFAREMVDNSERTIHTNYTSGPEDSRLLSDTTMMSVTLDTNNRFCIEMSLITFCATSAIIQTVQPLLVAGVENKCEKNWLYLRDGPDGLAHFLHAAFPFRIIGLDYKTGVGNVLKEYNVPGFNVIAHNGATLRHKGGYLITVRIKEGYSYKHSLFINMNDEYDVVGISAPFRFYKQEDWQTGLNEFKPGGYEMCMSMHIEGEQLVACVSIDDSFAVVHKYILTDIIAMCSPL